MQPKNQITGANFCMDCLPLDFGTGIPSGTVFTLYNFGDVSNQTGAQLDTASVANGVTGFWRPEDGAWDPIHPSDFYFVTTASFTGKSRLWRLHFDDLSNLPAGGAFNAARWHGRSKK